MTIQNAFWNWQDRPLQPDPQRCAPICTTWSRYLRDTWGGQDLGCYAPRPIVGGSSPSTHGSGAATDWRYQDPGPGRSFMLDTIMPWLIDNSLELGVQAIHDYVGCRIWRPPGTSGRPAQPSPESGWRQQTPGSQMGQSWALWLHVECLNTRWSDARTVDDMLGAGDRPGPGPDPEPQPDPEEDDVKLYLVLDPADGMSQYVTDMATFRTRVPSPTVSNEGSILFGWLGANPPQGDPISLGPGWGPYLDELPITAGPPR